LVNKSHKYDITSGVTDELVKISDYRLQNTPDGNYYYEIGKAEKLNKTAMEAFHLMLKDFVDGGGDKSIMLSTAFRSLKEQEDLHSSTKAGYSESHTGYILSLSIYKNDQTYPLYPTDTTFGWIYDHAHEYGFVARYPENKVAITGVSDYLECFRYVGKLNAYIMKQNNFCLEEYIDHLKKYTFEGEHFEVTDENGVKHEMYFVPTSSGELTTIPVPADSAAHEYTVSGTNAGGFVVTVKLS
jgi:LAS superfamily LD-carboxypeptidase LdcB